MSILQLLAPNKKYLLEKDHNKYQLNTCQYLDYAGYSAYMIELIYTSSIEQEPLKYYFYIKRKEYHKSHSWLMINSYSYMNERLQFNSGYEIIDIMCPIRGQKLGSIILNQLILWGKINYPYLKFCDLKLQYEIDRENKARRDKLYTNLGYKIAHDVAIGDFAFNMKANNNSFGFIVLEL
jgi:hypothetical protein